MGQLDDAIDRQARLLRQTERVSQTGSWRLERQSHLLTWSEGMYRLFGFAIDGFQGDGAPVPLEGRRPEDRERMERVMASLVHDGAPLALEFRAILPDGQIRWVRAEGAEEPESDGHAAALVGYVQDITRLKADENELAHRATQLERLLVERGRNLEQISKAVSSLIDVVCLVVENRDPYTAGHERRVSELAVRISKSMGLSADDVEEIRIAALIHDVGKVSVPAEILSKPGVLSPEELALVKCHSATGHSIIAKANMSGWIPEIVYQHHERCDGSGYPRGLLAPELVPGAKVMMVADVVEAMTSHRPYRPALGVDAALAEIRRGAGIAYDAGVCAACNGVFADGFEFSAVHPDAG